VSRLLQRLASQALGAGGPRVRSASAVHAQVPIALPVRERARAIDVARGFDADPTPAEPDAGRGARPDTALPPVHERLETPVERGSRAETARSLADVTFDAGGPRDPVAPSSDPWQPPNDQRAVPAPLPTPLLGSVESTSAAAIVTGAIRPAAPPDANPRASAEPTEVHVHIGRIEVTALHAAAAAPPRRGERPARQTVPLSDYLAKRRSS
jgi:hypothetical protein